MPNDTPVVQTVTCKTCGAALAVHLDRWAADAQHRQAYPCPACAKPNEGTFVGRIVRVTRHWETDAT